MTSHRNRLLAQEYKGLIDSIEKDMHLICTTAASCKKVLEDTPELIDDAYKTSSIESLKTLHQAKTELRFELASVSSMSSLADAETGEISRVLENIFQYQQQQTDPSSIPELARLESIVNAGNTLSSSSPRKRGKKRKSSRQNQSSADLEVVEDEEPNVRIDPLSLGPIKVLVQNKRCKHYYCYETIVGHIKTGPYPRCPIAGCSLPHIREDDLVFVN